jgi:WD40 repeat protein
MCIDCSGVKNKSGRFFFTCQFYFLCVWLLCGFSAVTVTRFLSDNLRLMSASSDKTVRIWDIAEEKQVRNYTEFKVSNIMVFLHFMHYTMSITNLQKKYRQHDIDIPTSVTY